MLLWLSSTTGSSLGEARPEWHWNVWPEKNEKDHNKIFLNVKTWRLLWYLWIWCLPHLLTHWVRKWPHTSFRFSSSRGLALILMDLTSFASRLAYPCSDCDVKATEVIISKRPTFSVVLLFWGSKDNDFRYPWWMLKFLKIDCYVIFSTCFTTQNDGNFAASSKMTSKFNFDASLQFLLAAVQFVYLVTHAFIFTLWSLWAVAAKFKRQYCANFKPNMYRLRRIPRWSKLFGGVNKGPKY